MSKPTIIFQGVVETDKWCSSCKRFGKGPKHYAMIFRSDRDTNEHFLMCEECAAIIEDVCTSGGRRQRTIGDGEMPKGEL